jgi:multicomponent Na+:H+ antiporter subunit F
METFAWAAMGVLLLCAFMCLVRIGHGPTAPDRTVAIDILGIILVGFCALLVLISWRDFQLSIAIAWALLSFVGTIALGKYLEGKGLDE